MRARGIPALDRVHVVQRQKMLLNTCWLVNVNEPKRLRPIQKVWVDGEESEAGMPRSAHGSRRTADRCHCAELRVPKSKLVPAEVAVEIQLNLRHQRGLAIGILKR